MRDIPLARRLRGTSPRGLAAAPPTLAAPAAWHDRPGDLDAWLAWNAGQIAAPEHAARIGFEQPFRIRRAAGTVPTRRGAERQAVRHSDERPCGPAGAALVRSCGRSG